MKHTKHEALLEWLAANPDKTERDWLLDVRCKDDAQREELKALFERVDAHPIAELEVCPDESYVPLNGDHVIYSTDNLPKTGSKLVEYDFGVGGFRYDLDAPDEVYIVTDPKRPFEVTWKFFRWKGEQLGVEPESFAKWAYDDNITMRTGYKHWRKLLKKKKIQKNTMCDYESYLPDDIRVKLEDNPVHTLLYLSGSDEALARAAEIIRRLNKNGIEPKGQSYGILPDEIREGADGDSRWFEIIIDNHVPQIYDELKSIDGIESLLFVVYSSFDTFINTNDVEGVMWKRRDMFGIPAELEVELVDDYPHTYDHASINYK